jgi:hypothetical protein
MEAIGILKIKKLKVIIMNFFGILKGLISDTEVRAARIDSSTHSLQTIMYNHHEIHNGSHYFIANYDDNFDNDAPIEFVVTTPDTTQQIHMTFSISAYKQLNLDVYENTAGVTGGTNVNPLNNNRNSSNTSNLTVVSMPTAITTDGDFLFGEAVATDKTGGFFDRNNEIILKRNTSYLFRFTTIDNDNIISYKAEWYEHTPKN